MANQSFIVDTVGGISGSLTTLVDGTSYLIAGTGVSITSQSNGSVLLAAAIPQGLSFHTASFLTSTTWTSPFTGLLLAEGCGGGGGGGSGITNSGGGGGGGSLKTVQMIPVASGTTYTITIGAGGTANHNGGDTTFDTLASWVGAQCGIQSAGSPNTPYGGPSDPVTTPGGLYNNTTMITNAIINVPSWGGYGGTVSSVSAIPGNESIWGYEGGTGGDQHSGGGGGGGSFGVGGNHGTAGNAGGNAAANSGAGGGGGGTSATGGTGGSGRLTIMYWS